MSFEHPQDVPGHAKCPDPEHIWDVQTGHPKNIVSEYPNEIVLGHPKKRIQGHPMKCSSGHLREGIRGHPKRYFRITYTYVRFWQGSGENITTGHFFRMNYKYIISYFWILFCFTYHTTFYSIPIYCLISE